MLHHSLFQIGKLPTIIIEQSAWFIPLSLLLAGAVSCLVYSKKAPWSNQSNIVLAVLRFLLISLLLILLLNPLLNQIINDVERPIFVIGIDNSSSMTNGLKKTELKETLGFANAYKEKLESREFDVHVHSLTQDYINLDSVRFDQQITNLDRWLRRIQSDYEGRNLGGVFLVSDGNYNQGVSPAFFLYNFKTYTIGVGDTLQKQDVILQNVFYNKIAFQGNNFPVVAEVVNYGLVGKESIVEIHSNGKLLASKKIWFNQFQSLQTVELEIEAKESGIQQLDVRIKILKGESVKRNNARRVFVDVVNGKQKILIIAPAPHPDLKAFSAVVDKNKNFELDHHVPNINELKLEPYDLVIVHQAYDKFKKTDKALAQLKEKGTPVFCILGDRSNIVMASGTEELFSFQQKGVKGDAVFGVLNDDFQKFTVPEALKTSLLNYPPLSVPYGDAILPPGAEVLLYQQVGSITTDKPLLYVVEQNQKKSAFLLSEGIWKWRMQEYALTESTASFDALFLKLIQYLSTKVDKRKFRFYPSKNEYFENEIVKFQSEVYNQIYERVYGDPIRVILSNNNGYKQEYSFTSASDYSRLEISNLLPGVYTYRAQATLNGKDEIVNGKFYIEELQLEELDQVADFNLLRQIADNTDGEFYLRTEKDKILRDITSIDVPGIIHTQEDIFPLIHLKWIFFILLSFVSIEWFVRKYTGGY